jgi:hypothetical protein
MMRNGYYHSRVGIPPNLMTSLCVSDESKTEGFQTAGDFIIIEARKIAHYRARAIYTSELLCMGFKLRGKWSPLSHRSFIFSRATSRAISDTSSTVLPSATSPGKFFEVARYWLSDSFFICTRTKYPPSLHDWVPILSSSISMTARVGYFINAKMPQRRINQPENHRTMPGQLKPQRSWVLAPRSDIRHSVRKIGPQQGGQKPSAQGKHRQGNQPQDEKTQ